MKFITIYTDNEKSLTNLGELIDNCEITSDYNKDSELIKIYLGFEKTSELFGVKIILNNKINDNTYWFYSEEERKQSFREDLPTLINKLIYEKISKINYNIIDPLIDNLLDIKKIKSVIPFDIKTLLLNDMLYMYSANSETIYGLDLNFIKFINLNIEELLIGIKGNSLVYSEEIPKTTLKNLPNKFLPIFI